MYLFGTYFSYIYFCNYLSIYLFLIYLFICYFKYVLYKSYLNLNNNNNNNNNNNSNDVIMKLIKNAKSKYFLLPGLSRKRMGLLQKKKKKTRKSAFCFLIKVPNLFFY